MTPARRPLYAFGLLLVGTLSAAASGQRPLNLGFERPTTQGTGRPWGWSPVFGSAQASLDSTHARTGRYSVRVTRAPGADDSEWAALRLFVPPLVAQRKKVQLTAWVRADSGAAPGIALESWAPGLVLAGDSVSQATRGQVTWTRRTLTIAGVDTAAFAVVITLGVRGTGTAWFDDLAFTVDGRRYDAVPVAPGFTPADAAWIDARTATLATVDPAEGGGATDNDLAVVDSIIGSARVIALGEDTHGTSEFFRLKDRILRHLVDRHGLRLFAIEANQMAVEGINRYVHGAPGSAREVMRAMFQVWNTTEMEALVEWMRARNARHPGDAVSFVGYDMQDPSLPVDSVRAFLDRHQPDLTATVWSLYASYREAWRRGPYPVAPDSTRKNWRENADSAWRILRSQAAGWLAAATTRSDSEQVDWAMQNANVVRQAAYAALTGSLSDRDSSMADNIRWLLEHAPSGARIVVWAHNGHVGRGSTAGRGFFGGRSMGTYLSRLLGNDLRVFGLVSYDGQYRGTLSGADKRLVSADAVAAPIGSYEEVLHRIAQHRKAPVLVTDLRAARSQPVTSSFRVPRPTRLTGYAVVDFDWEQMVSVPEVFDALLFVDHATASRTIERPQTQ